eukprot:2288207-Lingulodinium_polyedra.AAC.1
MLQVLRPKGDGAAGPLRAVEEPPDPVPKVAGLRGHDTGGLRGGPAVRHLVLDHLELGLGVAKGFRS